MISCLQSSSTALPLHLYTTEKHWLVSQRLSTAIVTPHLLWVVWVDVSVVSEKNAS